MKTDETTECEWCEGDGYLIGQHDGMPVQRMGDCEECNGTGQVPAPPSGAGEDR